MTIPNFLVIGAGRSGTTSLGHYLGQHPDVFVPRAKAPSYFYCADLARDTGTGRRPALPRYFVRDRERYEALFAGAREHAAVGEVSPVYLAAPRVAARIAAEVPHARLVAVLRDPVARLVARYTARRRDGLEHRELGEIVREEQARGLPFEDAFGTYVAAGFVGHVLQAYYDHFAADRLHVIRSEDLGRDPSGAMAGIFAFLGVEPTAAIDVGERHNASGGLISGRIRRGVWTRTAFARTALRPCIPTGLRDRAFGAFTTDLVPLRLEEALLTELRDLYREDVVLQQRLTRLDLSSWLESQPPPA